jgi:hypothetical protein
MSPRQLTYVTGNFYKSNTEVDFKLFFHRRGTIPYVLYAGSATILKLRIKSETTFHPPKKSTHFLESEPLVAWWWPNYLFFMLGHMMTTLTTHSLITCTCKNRCRQLVGTWSVVWKLGKWKWQNFPPKALSWYLKRPSGGQPSFNGISQYSLIVT